VAVPSVLSRQFPGVGKADVASEDVENQKAI